MPFVVRGETEFAQIVLRIPGGKLRDRVTTPVLDEILGRRISAQSGVGRLASRMLVDIVADVDELGDDECEHIAPAIAEMVAAAVAQCAPTPSLSQTDRIHARDLWMVQQALLAGIGDPERTVAQVGVELGMSVRYIHNLFTIVGTTPRKWLYDRRIDRACVLLRTTEYSCAEVCDELGFSDVSHFSRVFRRVTGTSPGGTAPGLVETEAGPQPRCRRRIGQNPRLRRGLQFERSEAAGVEHQGRPSSYHSSSTRPIWRVVPGRM